MSSPMNSIPSSGRIIPPIIPPNNNSPNNVPGFPPIHQIPPFPPQLPNPKRNNGKGPFFPLPQA